LCVCGSIALLPVITGCGSIVTSKAQANLPRAWSEVKGQPYYLPKGRIQVDCTWAKDTHEWVVRISPVIEPEKDARFILKRKTNCLFDDDITIGVDSNGLLQTVNATSEDKTVSSIADLIAAAGSALSFAAGIAPTGVKLNAIATNVYSFHMSIDPDKELSKDSPILTVPETGLPGMAPNTPLNMQFNIAVTRVDQPDQAKQKKPKRILEGIVVRTPVRYEVTVSATPLFQIKGQGPATSIVLLPDREHNYILPLSRHAFVKNSTQVTLANGSVQTLHITRPSVVAGVVGIPKTLLGALAPVPLQVIQTQDAYYKTKDDATKAAIDLKTLNKP
jgi:hypothetical protein